MVKRTVDIRGAGSTTTASASTTSGQGKLCFGSGEGGCCAGEGATEVVNLVVEVVDVGGVVAGVVRLEVAAADGECEAADCAEGDVDGVAVGGVVEVVACKLCAAFCEEVDIFAEAEAELDTCRHGECPLVFLDFVAIFHDVLVSCVEVPGECAADTCEGNDGECTFGVDAMECVEHIPHDVGVADYIFGAAEFP